VTDAGATGHSRWRASPGAVADGPVKETPASADGMAELPGTPEFEDVYERWFDFVWRTARRLGVPEAALDDVVQEVFVVVHRQLGGFEGRASLKTWLFGITRRVVGDHRRAQRRRPAHEPLREGQLRVAERDPAERAESAQAAELVHRLLDGMDDAKREVFVLVELEQMTAPEVAEALGVKLNTVYSRLRLARRDFERALSRERSRMAAGARFDGGVRAGPLRGRS
jgi:RNA polymerase sigma-70 factor, ECF subfamily